MDKEYTIYDEYGNSIRVELDQPPLVVKRCYLVGRYGESFVGNTNAEAVTKMEVWAKENTPYRGINAIAKHLGYYDLYIDDQGRRFLHGFYDGRGKFEFAHNGIS